jgi:DNA-binding MarR family transcriptional regulator
MSGMPERTVVTDEEWAVWRSFLEMRRRLEDTLQRELQQNSDISGPEYSVLISLFEAPGRQLRVGQLGASLAWEKSRVSHQVSRMEKRGLVERQLCDADARGTWVGLTPTGSRAVLAAMRPHAARLRHHFFDALSPEQLAVIGSASDAVLSTLEPCAVEEDA